VDKKKKDEVSFQEGAGGLLLMAAANVTGLLEHLEAAIGSPSDPTLGPVSDQESMQDSREDTARVLNQEGESNTAKRDLANRRKLVGTLLFLGVVGLRRTWDLRSYSGDALGLLVGRKRAYSYGHLERFLAGLAKTDAADRLTDVLGLWTSQLWLSPTHMPTEEWFYVDGHRKPVYSERLVPRGLIGRSGKILGCRALVLLHDEQGHPRLVTTHRGDLHLTVGLPLILARYARISGQHRSVVVDREGMGAAFLRDQAASGQTVVTILRANQYQGIESFEQVGPFVPLEVDKEGTIRREVAPARFALALPDQPGQALQVQVALIRDWRVLRTDALWEPTSTADPSACWQEDWQASASPVGEARGPRLIAIVTTGAPIDACELARTYIRRWPVQENIIRDFLLPLGLDTNHGYEKTPVVNSEAAKKRESLHKQLDTAKQRMASARTRYDQSIACKEKLLEKVKKDNHKYRVLETYQHTIDKYCIDYDRMNSRLENEKEDIHLQQAKKMKRVQQISDDIDQEKRKYESYAQKQCDILRSLEDVTTYEQSMYELDNRKDQIMTVFKVAMTNVAMWTRDQYFPDTYSAATWERLAPFFRLPGIIRSNRQTVSVSLRPFNDRQYNRDLNLLCQCINQKQPHLPDGRLLQFSVMGSTSLVLDGQIPLIA
jgi:hypothetical protein